MPGIGDLLSGASLLGDFATQAKAVADRQERLLQQILSVQQQNAETLRAILKTLDAIERNR